MTRGSVSLPNGARLVPVEASPDAVATRIDSAFWSITTNPFRSPEGRRRTFFENLTRLQAFCDRTPGIRAVRNMAEYRAARAAGDHAAWIVIQGGNALDAEPGLVQTIPDDAVL